MQNEKLKTVLNQLGYRDKEAMIYLALLELGNASVIDIANKTGLERTGIYDTLKHLKNEGLLNTTLKGAKKRFIAESPKTLLEIWKLKVKEISATLSEFETLHNQNFERPKVEYHEGENSLKKILEESIAKKDSKICAIISEKDIFEVLGKSYLKQYINNRIKHNVSLRVIRLAESNSAELGNTNKDELRSLKYAPSSMRFNVSTFLFNNKVAVISSKKEGYGLIITSRDYFDLQKQLFDNLWEISRTSNPNLDISYAD